LFAYIVRRVIAGVAMLVVMSIVTFALFFASPVDPARLSCGKNCSPQLMEQTRDALGYPPRDGTAMERYVTGPAQMWADFAKGIFVGQDYPKDPALKETAPQTVAHCPAPCLGYSVKQSENVRTLIADAIPVSISLALFAFVVWISGGIIFGVIAALRRGTFVDRGIVGVSLIAYALPTFFVGLLLYRIVAIKLGLVAIPQYQSIADGGVWAWFQGLWLPGVTLALFFMAGYVRMTRAFVLESMGEDYLRTATAKGLPRKTVVVKHSLRAALTPLVTMAGLDLAGLVGGAIITETVFNYPGLGKLAVRAAVDQDLPTTVGIVLLLATFVILANLIVDLLYAVIDPRVRVG
jgi:peptide/nickel transport system permease protein